MEKYSYMIKVKVQKAWRSTNFIINKETTNQCLSNIKKIEGVEFAGMLRYTYTITICSFFKRNSIIYNVKKCIEDYYNNINQ